MIKKLPDLPTATDNPGHSRRLKKMMSSASATKKEQNTDQASKFSAAARELGCDDDEQAFDAKLQRIASAPPHKLPKKRKKTK